ncbi:MAG TPA: hypothetical protein VIW68_05115 [Candidatus Sulfotelmatobacter sp.]
MSEVGDIMEICAYIAEFGIAIKEMRDYAGKENLAPNRYFIENGIDLTPSPKTQKNLFKRKLKGFASIGVSALGTIQHAATTGVGVPVNLIDIGKQASAVGSTTIHLVRLRDMAKKVRDGGSLARHINFLCEVKAVKLAARGAALGLACVPVPGVSLLSIPLLIARKGYDVYRHAVMIDTSMKLHWQAYRELKLLGAHGAIGGAGGSGPALRIIRELTGLGIGDLHSAKTYNEILLEPGGHHVILYKLKQS